MVDIKKKKVINVLILSVVLIFCMVTVSQTIGLSRGGFDTTAVINQFFFYATPGAVFLMGILIIFYLESLIKDGDKKYGDGIGFAPPGEFPSIEYFKKMTSFQLFLISSIFFSIIVSFMFITRQTTFTGVGLIGQQFQAVDALLFSSFLVPASENLGSAFFIAFILFWLRKTARKTKMSKENFRLIAIITVILVIGIYGLGNHLLRYSTQESSLTIVFFFWSLGGLLTIVTGSFIPFWTAHIFNNAVYDLARFSSNESLVVWAIFIVLSMTVLYAVLYLRGGRKKNESKDII